MTCIFVCYDIVQKNFFKDNGLNDLIYGLHPKTLKPFWVYERNEQFNIILEKWKKTKPIK